MFEDTINISNDDKIEIMKSNLLPHELSLYEKNDYPQFLNNREDILINKFNELTS